MISYFEEKNNTLGEFFMKKVFLCSKMKMILKSIDKALQNIV